MAANVHPEPPIVDWKIETYEGMDYQQGLDVYYENIARLQLTLLPAAGWRRSIVHSLDALGKDVVATRIHRVLSKVPSSKPGTMVQRSPNRELLRGLVWICIDIADADLIQMLQRATSFFYKKNSPLAVCGVTVLYHIATGPCAAALASIEQGLRAESQRAFLSHARTMLADKLGVDPTDFGDTSIATFGFTELGRLHQAVGDFRADIEIDGNRSTTVAWSKADGTALKSVPAAAKRNHADDVASIKATAKGVSDALASLCARLESTWLARSKLRPDVWRSQLIEHPLAGVVGRRLVWQFNGNGQELSGFWRGSGVVDLAGRRLSIPADATVTLWHPWTARVEDVVTWRSVLESEEITQPFKQTYREIYRLTVAERNTAVYSNRFASHIIRQAQFRQLAKSRGWKVPLVGPWDSGTDGVAERVLPRWNIRAEFWIVGIGDDYQNGYTYVSTDQVRFYSHRRGEVAPDPLPLDQVPPLVFSEILRDVDLFVGVASVGNDPNWNDGGPNGQYRDYWQSYSFGDLSATAVTRKALLERLVPRLKIAGKCSFEDKFLVVKGSIRTYKIHLGSGNILMKPNDQYLCIVAKQAVAGGERVHLPFEGDGTLSVILSKAFLLADDAKITDPTITSQLRK
jgi:hypothetical protein